MSKRPSAFAYQNVDPLFAINAMIRPKRVRNKTASSSSRKRNSKSILRRHASFQSLEDRRMLAVFEVTTLLDTGAGSLRQAIISANGAANPGIGPDQITFASGLTGTISVGQPLGITDPVIITGPGSASLTLRSTSTVASPQRLFDIGDDAGDVTIVGLTIRDGKDDSEGGGAIRSTSSGTLTIRNSVLTGNRAIIGGAVMSAYEGNIVIENSQLTNNVATDLYGGAVYSENGDITITGSTLSNNESAGSGGAVASLFGNITIGTSTLNLNRITEAGFSGGAVYSDGGNLSVTGSTFDGNTGADQGGAIFNFEGTFELTDSVITGNEADGGGGVFNDRGTLSVLRTLFDDNETTYIEGGGISNGSGNATITGSTIKNNRSVDDGGGISNVTGRMIIRDSLITGNSSTIDGGGVSTRTGDIAVINSTVHDNSAGLDGGGLHADAARITLVHSTVTANDALLTGGGVGFEADLASKSLMIHNSIVAENTATSGDGDDFLAPPDPATSLVVANSLIGKDRGTSLTAGSPASDNNYIGTHLIPISPALGALSSNGGPVQTRIPSLSSLVIDRGSTALAMDTGADARVGGADDTPLTTDGRTGAFLRINDGTPDMGAIETQPPPALIVDNASDIDDGNVSAGNRSLREMIATANSLPGADSITFNLPDPTTITLTSGLNITEALTIEGPDADKLTIDGGGNHRILNITGTAATIRDLKLAGGDAGTGNGGAILFAGTGVLALIGVQISDSTAASGGGLAATSGKVALVSSTIEGSTATQNGGGIFIGPAVTNLDLINVTLSGNSAANGGGIEAGSTKLQIESSTIAANTATTAAGGVRITTGAGVDLIVENSIIATNVAPTAPDLQSSTLTTPSPSVIASIVGDSGGSGLTPSGAAPNANGSRIGGVGVNLINPMLGTLVNNGGAIDTIDLLPGSPAINAGRSGSLPLDVFDLDTDAETSEALPLDAIGRNRVNGTLDIGALESIASPTVTWEAPAAIVFGTTLGASQLRATSPTPGSFIYTPAAGTVLNAGDDQVLSVTFTPTDTTNFRSVTITTTIDVTKADPSVTWANPTTIVYGTLLSATQLNATSTVPGGFVYTPAIGTLLDAGAQTLSTTFTPTDTANYNTVTRTVPITVSKANPVVTWAEPPAINQGTALSTAQLNASSVTPGTFVYTPAAGVVLPAGDNQTLSVKFTPTDAVNFNEVTQTTTIDVIAAAPNLDFGDAPTTYPVTRAQDGARHSPSALFLGTAPSIEADGKPSAEANLDDKEDGVEFVTSIVSSATAATTASVLVNSSGAGRLDAWIDFNNDGDWEEANEKIINRTVSAGDNLISFTVPAGAAGNVKTAARFRLHGSTAAIPTGVRGEVTGGEVEDYMVRILNATSTSDANVSVSGQQTQISAGVLSVQSTATPPVVLFQAPVASLIGLFLYPADENADNVFTVAGYGDFQKTLTVQGGGGVDQLVIDAPEVDLTDNSLKLVNIEEIDFRGTVKTNVLVDSESGTGTGDFALRLILGGADTAQFAAPAEWLITGTTTINNVFYSRAVHDSEQEILVSQGSGWTNPILPEDVNADGSIQPTDALIVINFIRRGQFYTGINRVLVPGGSVTPTQRNYVDNDADGSVSPIDVLRVINYIRRRGAGESSADQSSIDLSGLRISQLSGDTAIKSRTTTVDAATNLPEFTAQTDSSNDEWFKLLTGDTLDSVDDLVEIGALENAETQATDFQGIDNFFAKL